MTKSEALEHLDDWGVAAADKAVSSPKGSTIQISAEAMVFAHNEARRIIKQIDSLY